jgi:plastocyanin
MAGQSWSVVINSSGNSVVFDPDIYGVPPGSPLQAAVGDLVCWDNQTDAAHTLTVSGETLEAGAWKSTNAFQIQNPDNTPIPFTITYTCTVPDQPDATGQIEVIA